ncbi:MAG: S-layer homology domain-containing protein [Candidatus Gracilibacteria bacterium]|nr:S-layer homology domain-containing protein [bacterium]MDZ4216707.1 S-layer homology domain-containing protein [Candidatus Gracilibacteria bacterium]
MKKRLPSSFLTLLLPLFAFCIFSATSGSSFGGNFTFTASAAPFSDVRSGSVLETMLEYLVEQEIFSGYPDGSFQPARTINRAEALKIIFSTVQILLDDQNAVSSLPFPDVDKGAWYAPYVALAKLRNIVQGYPDGNFKPGQEVNRAEFIKMAMSALPFFNKIPQDSGDAIAQFSDVYDEQWYTPHVSAAMTMKFLATTDKLRPTEPMQRQEAAEIIYNIATYIENNPSSISSDSNIPYVPEEAMTIIDPTFETSDDPELGPDQLIVKYDFNKTEIFHKLNGFNLTIDEAVTVKAFVETSRLTHLTFDNGCFFDIYTDDNSKLHLTPQTYFEQESDPDNFMEPPISFELIKATEYPNLEVYKIVSQWSVIGTVEEYFIYTPGKIYSFNAYGPGKSHQECKPIITEALNNFEIR